MAAYTITKASRTGLLRGLTLDDDKRAATYRTQKAKAVTSSYQVPKAKPKPARRPPPRAPPTRKTQAAAIASAQRRSRGESGIGGSGVRFAGMTKLMMGSAATMERNPPVSSFFFPPFSTAGMLIAAQCCLNFD